MEYLKELYGIDPNLDPGDHYAFSFDKKFGSPFYLSAFEKMINSDVWKNI
ncbi:MAG: hypothetical protein KC589_04645 [Nanoarchaeota archaeon]|nr:hypothetical protein [Nanoarchaeota archaeon]